MQDFDSIIIDTSYGNIEILDDNPSIYNVSNYHISDHCLYIETNGNCKIVVSPKKYKLIQIDTASGNCSISFSKAEIEKLEFDSSSGNLKLNAKCDDIDFDSASGVLIQTSDFNKCSLTARTQAIDDDDEGPSYINGERYK